MDFPADLLTAERILGATTWLLLTPLRILLIIVAALILRWFANRAIRRLTRRTVEGPPAVLRPLKERVSARLTESPGLLSERRRQRAETMGSVLRSFTSIVIFTIAALLILDELAIDLAPLLASAGIAGVALGFGAQFLIRDVIAGLFMIIEDQYGVGDTVDLGEAIGTVEGVGLRVTVVRDVRGVVWYVRNGEVIRVGNMSQGWARVVIDVPIGLETSVEEAVAVIRTAAMDAAEDEEIAGQLVEPPEVWGVEAMTVDGAVVRLVVKTVADAQWDVGRSLRRRVVEALNEAGITARLASARIYVRRPTGEAGGTAGATGGGAGGGGTGGGGAGGTGSPGGV